MDNDSKSLVYCFNFTASDLTYSRDVAVTLHILAILACLLAICFIFLTKQHLQYVNRLILYLIIVSLVWSVSIIFQTVPVEHDQQKMDVVVKEGWQGACEAIGYLSQFMESVKILMVCWIVLHLFLLIIFKYNLRKKSHEVAGLLVVVGVPLLKDWIPFVRRRYGLSGLWCWIRLTDEHCGSLDDGIIMMAIVEYIPVLLAIIFTVVCFINITVTLCKRAHRADMKWKWTAVYQQGMAEAATLMVYPGLFAVSFIIRIIHRTLYIIEIKRSHSPSSGFWITHSVALGITGILVPLFYIMRPSNLKKFYFCRKFVFKKTLSPVSVIYRTSSVISTEGFSEGESIVKEPISGKGRESNQLYTRSIFNTFSD